MLKLQTFFEGSDWQNRNLDSYLYHTEYLLFFVFAVILCIGLPLYLRRFQKSTIRKVLIAIWATALAYDIFKWIISWTYTAITNQEFSMFAGLPLHTCSSYWYVAPLAILLPEGKIKTAFMNYQCTILLWGGMMGMFLCVAMMTYYSFTSFYGSQIQIYHMLILLTTSTMLITGYYKPKKKDYIYSFLLFVAIAIPVYIFNCIFETDYMYTYNQSALYIFQFIYDLLPHRICWTFLAVAAYFGLCYLLTYMSIGIRALYCRIVEKVANKKCTSTPSDAADEIGAGKA